MSQFEFALGKAGESQRFEGRPKGQNYFLEIARKRIDSNMRTNCTMLSGMGTSNRTTIIALGGEALVLGAGAVIGDVAGYALMAAGGVAIAATMAWPLLKGGLRINDLKPIREMSALMYNRASPSLRQIAVMVARLSDEGSKPEDYFVGALAVLAENGELEIFGRSGQNLVHEAIPKDYFDFPLTTDENGNAVKLFSERRIEWFDLHVSKAAALRGLREYENDARRQELNQRR